MSNLTHRSKEGYEYYRSCRHAGGLALITFLLWFFFGPKQGKAALRASAQEATIRVEGAYQPNVVMVKAVGSVGKLSELAGDMSRHKPG